MSRLKLALAALAIIFLTVLTWVGLNMARHIAQDHANLHALIQIEYAREHPTVATH